jgi:glycosyltransferase involved in cell wall biosynthesis
LTTKSCDVTVIIPCFNAERYLPDAIESVWAQTLQPVEVVVVDDASTDQSVETARAFGSRVRVIECGTNSGYCVVPKDIGLDEAGSEYVAFLDADDVWLPRKLELQMSAFNDPAVGLVYGRAQTFRTGKPPHTPPWPKELPAGDVAAEFYFRNYPPNSSVVARRAALLEAGGFDRTLDFCEDYDLWVKTAFRWKVAAIPDVVMLYRDHPDQQSHRRLVQARAHLAVENRHAEQLKQVTGISESERRKRTLARLFVHMESEFYLRNLALARMYADFIVTNFPDLDDASRKRVRKFRNRTYWPRIAFTLRDWVTWR